MLLPSVCQFTAYVGHRAERNLHQCRRDYGHTGAHVSAASTVLSLAQCIRNADGTPGVIIPPLLATRL
jgi:hypothetical protein